MCNRSLTISKSQYNLVHPDVYHPSIEFNIPLDASVNDFSINDNAWKYDFKHANYEDINAYMNSIDWENIVLNVTNIDHVVDIFYSYIYYALETFVPKFLINNARFPSWYSLQTKKSIKRKNQLYNKYRRSNSPTDYERYKCARSTSKNYIEKD